MLLKEAHFAFMAKAAKAKMARIWVQSIKAHSPGAIDYLSSVLHRKIPNPSYHTNDISSNNQSYTYSEFETYPNLEDDNYEKSHPEGKERSVIQTVYERNPENRRICIEHYKEEDDDKRIKCQICGFDFEEVYCELGREFIEVHHKTPLSELQGEVSIRPIIDLIPVCSNCHRMLHRSKDNCLSVDDLKQLIKNNTI